MDKGNPELERLWALRKIEEIQSEKDLGLQSPSESEDAIQDIAIQYQIVTDYTSMIVLDEQTFQQHGIERRNAARTAQEHQAQSQRVQAPAQNYRVDQDKPAYQSPAPRIKRSSGGGGGGGGAIDPLSGLLLLGLPFLKKFRRQTGLNQQTTLRYFQLRNRRLPMKKLNQVIFASTTAILGLASTAACADTRLEQVMWTDRGIANPPLSENTSTINESIERFWNLPVPEPTTTTNSTYSEYRPAPRTSYHCQPSREPYRYSTPVEKHTHTTVVKQPNHSISQQKNQRDKRGYFGINLFNMIPLIDIVTGSSETTSSDHVEASR